MYRRKGNKSVWIAFAGLALASLALLLAIGLAAQGAWAGAPAQASGSTPWLMPGTLPFAGSPGVPGTREEAIKRSTKGARSHSAKGLCGCLSRSIVYTSNARELSAVVRRLALSPHLQLTEAILIGCLSTCELQDHRPPCHVRECHRHIWVGRACQAGV